MPGISFNFPEWIAALVMLVAFVGAGASAGGWARDSVRPAVRRRAAKVGAGISFAGLLLTLFLVFGRVSFLGAVSAGLALVLLSALAAVVVVGGILHLSFPLPLRFVASGAVVIAIPAMAIALGGGVLGFWRASPLPSEATCARLLTQLAPANQEPGTAVEIDLPPLHRWFTVNGKAYVLRTQDGRVYLFGRTLWMWHDNYEGFLFGLEPLTAQELHTDEKPEEGIQTTSLGWISFQPMHERELSSPNPVGNIGAIKRRRGNVYYEVRNFNELN